MRVYELQKGDRFKIHFSKEQKFRTKIKPGDEADYNVLFSTPIFLNQHNIGTSIVVKVNYYKKKWYEFWRRKIVKNIEYEYQGD